MSKMAIDLGVAYQDTLAELDYMINLQKYKSLSEIQKLNVMKNLREALEKNSASFPFIPGLVNTRVMLNQPHRNPNAIPSNYSTNGNYLTRSDNQRFNSTAAYLKKLEETKKSKSLPLKINLGVLPTNDFAFSRDLSQLPDYYRFQKEQPITAPRFFTCQAPINLVIGNVSILNHTSNIQNFFTTNTSNMYAAQQPQGQSVFTYFYGGSAIDQQLALRNQNAFTF